MTCQIKLTTIIVKFWSKKFYLWFFCQSLAVCLTKKRHKVRIISNSFYYFFFVICDLFILYYPIILFFHHRYYHKDVDSCSCCFLYLAALGPLSGYSYNLIFKSSPLLLTISDAALYFCCGTSLVILFYIEWYGINKLSNYSSIKVNGPQQVA